MPLTTANLAQLKKMTTPELRQLASKQLGQAWQALEAGKKSTDDVSWYQQPLQVAHYLRWRPETDALKGAEEILKTGDAEADDSAKRARYSEVYRTAFQTAESIAKEAKLPPTNFTTIWQSEVTAPLDQALEDLKKRLKEPVSNLSNAVTTVGVIWVIYQLVKKR